MFKILKQSKISQACLGKLFTLHGVINTPFFIPIASKGSVKAVEALDLKKMNSQIILGNTYHLYLEPGLEVIKKVGGLHKFMAWDGPILTDSGGFQVFSLSNQKYQISNIKYQKHKSNIKNSNSQNSQKNLVRLTERGVYFKSYLNGSEHFFTPEKVIKIQKILGSDVMMVLDVCSPYPSSYKEAERDVELTTKWAERSRSYLSSRRTLLQVKHNVNWRNSERKLVSIFGIIQGSCDKDLRIKSAKEIIALGFDGYAIGGFAVGEPENKMWPVLSEVILRIPKDKPRYLMGLGKPEQIVKAVQMGIDMFDCVLPTRNARHGRLYVFNPRLSLKQYFRGSFYKTINITNAKYKLDTRPLDKNCSCQLCQSYTRAYLHHLFKIGESLSIRLATLHNLNFYLKLMREIRQAIKDNKL